MPANDHYIIIGNGPAGNSAADFLRQFDVNARITIISSESFSYYYRHKLPDYIEGSVSEKDLYVRNYSFYKENNIRLRLGQVVEKIDPVEKTLFLKHMEKVHYTKLVIASGGIPDILTSMSDFSEYLHFLTTYEDALKLRPKISVAKDILVLGGDLITFKIIKMLLNLKINVSLILYTDAFWPFPLTEEMSAEIEQRLKNKGVTVLKDEQVESVSIDGTKYQVLTDKGLSKPYDLIFSFPGRIPNIKFIVGSGIDTDRGVLVDDNLRTNFEDIYACGDCAQIFNPKLNSYWVSVGWGNAKLQGKTVAENLLGDSKVIKPTPKKMLDVEGIKVNTSWWESL